ncbi:uncharacterized protein FFB14_15156 [Fusarium fujikuroi]|nr:uncharacterized protein FFB14_15156 [Fusarium fujikuroi]
MLDIRKVAKEVRIEREDLDKEEREKRLKQE